MKIDTEELVSQKEAAEIRGISIQAIHKLMKRGRFTVIEISGIRFLLRKEIETYEARPRGRPRKDSASSKSSSTSKATKRRDSKTAAKKKRPR